MINTNIRLNVSDILFFVSMVFVLVMPGPSWMKALSIIAFFCYMMLMKALKSRKIKNNVHVFGALLFLGYAYLSHTWASYPQAVFEQLTNVLWTIMLSTAVSSYVAYRDLNVKEICNRLVPIAILFCINVLINATFNGYRLSIEINANAFGRLAGGLACFLLYQCKQYKWKNIFWDIMAAVLILLTLLSGSRTSVLLVGIYILAFLLFEHQTKNKLKLLVKLMALGVLFLFAYACLMNIEFLYNSIGNRIETLLFAMSGVSEGDGSIVTRKNMVELAWGLFKENPLFGIGMNNFKYVTYHDTYAHNNYYELAACMGIFGLVIYYSPILVYLKRAISGWRENKADMIVPIAILVAFLVGDIGGVSYFNPISHVFVGLAIGLISKSKLTEERNRHRD